MQSYIDKPCIKCKYCKTNFFTMLYYKIKNNSGLLQPICGKKIKGLGELSAVTGKATEFAFTIKRTCYDERHGRGTYSCGDDGQYWEPKRKLFK